MTFTFPWSSYGEILFLAFPWIELGSHALSISGVLCNYYSIQRWRFSITTCWVEIAC